MKVLRIQMADKSVWEVPLMVVAKDRCNCFYDPDGKIAQKFIDLWVKLPSEATTYVQDNMVWKDLKDHARLIYPAVPNYDHWFLDADLWIMDGKE